MPLGWEDRKGAVNDLLIQVSIKHELTDFYIPFIFELKMEDEFSPEKMLELILDVKPFSKMSSICKGMYTIKHLNLKSYLEAQIDYKSVSTMILRSRILSGFIARGLLYNPDLLDAIGSTLPMDRKLFNVESYSINYKKSADLIIVAMGTFDNKDYDRLKAA
jgi:hypothetical protein